MDKSLDGRFQGALLSMPTFNDETFHLQLDRQRIHINWLIDNGIVEGQGVLIIAGGMGEGYFLEPSEWETLADLLVSEARGRIPTGIGVKELSARRAAYKAKYAANAGLDCIQVSPPHYLLPTEEEIFQHFKYINDAAIIPIIAYNTPWAMPHPGYEFSETLLSRFSDLENLVAIKWSTQDYRHCMKMIRLFKDRFTFLDNNRILSHGGRVGSRGFTDFFGNVAPRLSLRKWELYREERFDELDELELAIEFDPAAQASSRPDLSAATILSSMGEGPAARLILNALGMDSGPPFPAQVRQTEDAVKAYRKMMEESGFMDWVDWKQSIFEGIG